MPSENERTYPGCMSETPDTASEAPEPTADVPDADRETFMAKHPFLVYSALRLVVLLAVGGVLYLLGARGLVLILLAFLLSAVASYVVVSSQRDAVGSHMGGFFGRMNERIEESKRSEDEFIDHEAALVREEQRQVAQREAANEPVEDSPADPRNNSAG